MSDSSPASENVPFLLGIVALAGGLVQIVYKPFLIGTAALAVALLATFMSKSKKNRKLLLVTMFVITIGFVVGASIASTMDNPIY
ncbi:MAG: hypothetical protein F2663_07365 [Actinobacteria bacterium]|uniref:Unannotated protein n=1 Tax=freshwater metagenome TaxID=449393 RepID=A0A6J6Q250_9ZZZZ|nr:hypothetical protein [Actinomycetota bacterium]